MPAEARFVSDVQSGRRKPRRPSDNERKACDAVVRALEALAGCRRTGAHSPEDLGAEAQVEYMFDLADVRHAVEHTIVEAFAGQIRTNVDFQAFVDPIIAALDYNMPAPGRFDLVFEIDPSKGLKPRHIQEAQRAVIAWVAAKAAELHAESPVEPSRNHKPFGVKGVRAGSPTGIKLTLTREIVWSLPKKAHGRLFVIRSAPKDYENLRRERLKMAMQKKLPKLQARKEASARTILILENGDMALSNHWVIYESAETALAGRADRPDEVWLVDTTIANEWTAWCLIRDGQGFPDDETTHRFWNFKPSELEAVG